MEFILQGNCAKDKALNKFLAKVASDMNKPNGITEVPFDTDEIVQWLAPLEVSKIWGVGITNFNKAIQTNLFENGAKTKAWNASEEAMDIISERFGKDAIFRAREATEINKKKSN